MSMRRQAAGSGGWPRRRESPGRSNNPSRAPHQHAPQQYMHHNNHYHWHHTHQPSYHIITALPQHHKWQTPNHHSITPSQDYHNTRTSHQSVITASHYTITSPHAPDITAPQHHHRTITAPQPTPPHALHNPQHRTYYQASQHNSTSSVTPS